MVSLCFCIAFCFTAQLLTSFRTSCSCSSYLQRVTEADSLTRLWLSYSLCPMWKQSYLLPEQRRWWTWKSWETYAKNNNKSGICTVLFSQDFQFRNTDFWCTCINRVNEVFLMSMDLWYEICLKTCWQCLTFNVTCRKQRFCLANLKDLQKKYAGHKLCMYFNFLYDLLKTSVAQINICVLVKFPSIRFN